MRRMRAFFRLIAAVMLLAQGAVAQEMTALARVDPAQSVIEDHWFGKTTLTLALSQGVPFRVFVVEQPPRLIVDFREVDWHGITPEMILPAPGRIKGLRFGGFRPGWSRLVAEFDTPMLPDEIAMPVDPAAGTARLELTLRKAAADDFARAASRAPDANWGSAPAPAAPGGRARPEGFLVALDPGHGGIDPGAESDGLQEKDLMLNFARALAEALRRDGVEVMLTRDGDHFVALETRVALAHRAGADVFISLHADSLHQGGAKGATIYTLSDEASDAATAHLAARHNRSDIIAGVDLTGSDDEVAGVLLDLARRETEPRTADLARTLAEGMAAAGGPMNSRPLREAGFSVLKSADIPSVLVELGFLSSKRDLANLRDPVWRAVMVDAMAEAILRWRDLDAARKPLMRQ